MCGIAGVLGQGAGQLPNDAIERALEQMRHRGPDETTVWSRPDVRLAHARLAIIDRQHGKQPMVTADGRFVVVFNGEIYNHRDLRRELLNSGWPLSTDCDTEVLPYLYAQHGPGMVERLRGMFAFVIVDLERREAFMARDPFGKKPLYFRAKGETSRSRRHSMRSPRWSKAPCTSTPSPSPTTSCSSTSRRIGRRSSASTSCSPAHRCFGEAVSHTSVGTGRHPSETLLQRSISNARRRTSVARSAALWRPDWRVKFRWACS